MKENPQHLLRENAHLRARIAALEGEIDALKGKKAEAGAVLPRADFIREIARMVAHDERYGGTSSLLVLSFEGLEAYKKTDGAVYFKVMEAAGECIARNVRTCDIVGQTGGEDFSIMLTRCAIADAEKKAELLAGRIKEKVDPLLQNKIGVGLRYAVSILNTRS